MDTTNTTTDYDWNDKLQDEGSWNRIKGKVREEWAEFTDQELEEVRGNWEQFKGFVQQKTGAAADKVEQKLREIF
ncbi:MAG: CsbD family protein [Acidimicrobiia bacterium]|nr:CsbD family protein [Acidimicrobiia bacterium]